MAEDTPHTQLSAELTAFVDGLVGEDVSIGEVLDAIADRGFGLILLILALPAALPLPAPGYATPFGLMMALLALQMMRGRRTPWFPERVRARRISRSKLAWTVKNAGVPLRFVEWIIRPRLSGLARNRAFLSLIGFIVLLMSISMSMPIPLTNRPRASSSLCWPLASSRRTDWSCSGDSCSPPSPRVSPASPCTSPGRTVSMRSRRTPSP